MRCAWKELLSILPTWLRPSVDKLGREDAEELRLRLGAPPELVQNNLFMKLNGLVTKDDLNFVVNAASQYSPWRTITLAKGYLTAPGGHRIGICGEVIYKGETVEGIREIYSLCIRIARDFSQIVRPMDGATGSVMIIGAPGWGKTTLLRDLIRKRARMECVAVVDEREELFPCGFALGERADRLYGCPKASGIEMVLRTMGPACIAVDEVTAEADAHALILAANCGVQLLATAHASSLQDFCNRSIYRPLVQCNVFDSFFVLHKDKHYTVERMTV